MDVPQPPEPEGWAVEEGEWEGEEPVVGGEQVPDPEMEMDMPAGGEVPVVLAVGAPQGGAAGVAVEGPEVPMDVPQQQQQPVLAPEPAVLVEALLEEAMQEGPVVPALVQAEDVQAPVEPEGMGEAPPEGAVQGEEGPGVPVPVEAPQQAPVGDGEEGRRPSGGLWGLLSGVGRFVRGMVEGGMRFVSRLFRGCM
jgi:hypothetical protein